MEAYFLHVLVEFITDDLRPCVRELREYLNEKRAEHPSPEPEQPDPLHDVKYAEGRIGVGAKTISRLTHKGLLPVVCYINGKRQFKESDIERCRRLYGRE